MRSDEPRKRGRPPKATPDETLHVRVEVELYDRICALALRVGKPVTVVARLLIERDLARMERRASDRISA
jgi:predicted DNA-binding protein